MLVASKKTLKVDLDSDVKERFDAICEARRISLVDAIGGLTESLHVLDDTGQAALLGQIEVNDDLIALILGRLKQRRPRFKPKGVATKGGRVAHLGQ